MKAIDRRGFIATAGLSLGAPALLLGGRPAATPAAKPTPAFPWRYEALDPTETAEQAYTLISKGGGGCMYAVFAAIVGSLATRLGEPYRSFPLDMMQYGKGGVAGQGSLCGAVNGGAAALGLLAGYGENGLKLIREVCQWYEQTELPVFTPRSPADAASMPRSISKSLLCRDSVAAWCAAAGLPASHPQRFERCHRLTADVARKTVELLNARLAQQS
jgi:hypothetical protein